MTQTYLSDAIDARLAAYPVVHPGRAPSKTNDQRAALSNITGRRPTTARWLQPANQRSSPHLPTQRARSQLDP